MQDSYANGSQAWVWAVSIAVLISLAYLLAHFMTPLIAFINFAVMFCYAWGHFALLRRFTDDLLLWLIIFAGGGLLPVMILLFFVK